MSDKSSGILLTAGTNEFEVLVFKLGHQYFGVNVAKVREVIQPRDLIQPPKKHPSVLGLITLRDRTLSIIDLRTHLLIPEDEKDGGANPTIIITEFNGQMCGFLVDGVERIHRVSWSCLLPIPSWTGRSDSNAIAGVTTGAIDLDDQLVLLIDFESVSQDVFGLEGLETEAVDAEFEVDRSTRRVIIAEDSVFMRRRISDALANSGYERAELYSDGAAAWDAISDPDTPKVHAVVSDIEMPRMDGLNLTSRIRQTPHLSGVPVVLFSSLVSADNANKGAQVGATAQITKPELPDLIRLVDRLVTGRPIEDLQKYLKSAA